MSIEIQHLSKTFFPGTSREHKALKNVSLSIQEGDFITIVGGNGAGKSTFLNAIAGNFALDEGTISFGGHQIEHTADFERAAYISRVFQDPMQGTAPRMTVAENILIAKYRGEKRGLLPRKIHSFTDEFKKLVARTGNGLEKHLDTPTGLLSGGQRQALSLLMATLKRPELLLLDEHTAALDPKTSVSLMNLTDEFVTGDQLTALMITHHMEDALKYGNRLIVMKDGKIIKDLNQDEKAQMAIADYYQLFE